MRKSIVFTVLVLFCTSEALAWGVTGHRLVASIAFRQLTIPERDATVAILKKHPRYNQDFDDRMPANVAAAGPGTQNEWLFQQAALWPDMARDFHGELKAKYHNGNWHFINLPIFLTDADRLAMEGGLTVNVALNVPATVSVSEKNMNAVQVIRFARQRIKEPAAPAEEKALLLAWLFHNAGDIHQPMHSTALFSRNLFPQGDRGGNLVSTEQQGNLHSLWDRFPGPSASFFKARNSTFAMLADPALKQIGQQAAAQLDEKTWLDESHELAKTMAYDDDVRAHMRVFEMDNEAELTPIDLGETYLKAGGKKCDERLIQAGFRLGAVLKQLVN